MNRRDTVIAAALVNAVLLLVLFTTARRVNEPTLPLLTTKLSEIQPSPLLEKVERPTLSPPDPVGSVIRAELISQPVESQTEQLEPVRDPLPVHEEQEAFVTVVVKKGDFLERIARANRTTVATLMQINDLSTTQLKIGQVIKVPVVDEQEVKSQTKSVNPDDYYVVKEGDSPWAIAMRNGIRLEDLLQLNGLDEQKARRLRPGDRLRIR